MDPRKLVVAAVAGLIAAGLVWWSSTVKSKEASATPPDIAKKQVLTLKQEDLRKIEIRRRDAESTTLESADGKTWRLVEPFAAATDSEAVSTLVSNFASLSAEEIVDEYAKNFGPYGLETPYIVLTATLKDNQTKVLRIGDEAPVGSGSYARLGQESKLFTVASYTKTALDKFGADLRDRRLLTVDFDTLQRFTLVSKSGEVEFARAGSDWRMVKPMEARADGGAVEDALRKLREAKFDATLTSDDQKEIAKNYPLSERVALATVSDGSATQTLELRKSKSAEKIYVKTPAVGGVQLLQGTLPEGLDKAAADYRNKKLFDFGFAEPTKVEFHQGDKHLVLTKSDAKWLSGGKEMDPVGVQSLIDRLRDLSSSGFPTGSMPAAAIQLAVSAKDSTEKVLLGKAAEKWYAQRQGDPALYELTADAVSQLEKTAGDVKPAPATPAKK